MPGRTIDLSTSVAGIPLTSCLYNASGPRSGTAAALHKVAESQSGAVLTKSATLLSQNGNPQPRTWHAPDGLASLNSEGLPNNGIDYYISGSTYTETMEDIQEKKPYIVSLSGKTLNDNLEMLKRIASCSIRDHIAGIELNLACPNVIGKPIIAYDFEQMDQILVSVGRLASSLPPLGVKLPPYLDFQHFQMAANILNKHKTTVKYVASINTIGNATSVDIHSESPHISSNQGFAGLSGPAVRYTALANVRKLRELLDPSIDVVGVGGIVSGQDVFEFLLAGAVACQTATTHWKEGPGAFERILDELRHLMQEKGYSSVQQVQGKLKEWSKEGAALSRQKTKAAAASGVLQETKESDAANQADLYRMISVLFAVIIAMLLADKFM